MVGRSVYHIIVAVVFEGRRGGGGAEGYGEHAGGGADPGGQDGARGGAAVVAVVGRD